MKQRGTKSFLAAGGLHSLDDAHCILTDFLGFGALIYFGPQSKQR
jgi:hypothetical protein